MENKPPLPVMHITENQDNKFILNYVSLTESCDGWQPFDNLGKALIFSQNWFISRGDETAKIVVKYLNGKVKCRINQINEEEDNEANI